MKIPVADGVNDPTLGEFADSVEYTFDLGCCSEDSDADLVGFTGVGHEPVFSLAKVFWTVYVLECLDTAGGGHNESGVVSTPLGHLQKRTFGMPSEETCRGCGGEWAEQLEKFGIE
jgi:hypothetical protein